MSPGRRRAFVVRSTKSLPARSRLSDHVSKTQRPWPRRRSFMAKSRLARSRATCHVAKTGRAPRRESFCAVERPPTSPRQNRTGRAFVPATSRHREVVAVSQRTRISQCFNCPDELLSGSYSRLARRGDKTNKYQQPCRTPAITTAHPTGSISRCDLP